MSDRPVTSLDEALETQRRKSWSDAELLARCLRFLRGSTLPDVNAVRERAEAELMALPDEADDAERAALVARALPLCWGPWGSSWLGDALASDQPPRGPGRDPLLRGSDKPPDQPPAPVGWLTPVRIVIATWVVIALVAIVITLLG